MSAAATFALVRWQAARMRPGLLGAAAASALAALLTGSLALRSGAALASALVTLLAASGATFAATAGEGGSAPRNLLLLSAPLYGRQLARALAIAPGLAGLACALAGWAGALAAGRGAGAFWAVPFLAAPLAATIALSATLREGARALLYTALAIGSGCLLACLPLLFAPLLAALGALATSAALGFIALRAFGEALARYDPVR